MVYYIVLIHLPKKTGPAIEIVGPFTGNSKKRDHRRAFVNSILIVDSYLVLKYRFRIRDSLNFHWPEKGFFEYIILLEQS